MYEETMMTVTKSDLISRADAIEEAKKEYELVIIGNDAEREDAERRNVVIDSIIDHIKALPSAEAVQGWIPCSEGLPDVGERCLVTLSNKVVAIGTLHSAGECVDDSGYIVRWGQRWHLEPSSMMIAYPKDSVVAWMPRPKPYEGVDTK